MRFKQNTNNGLRFTGICGVTNRGGYGFLEFEMSTSMLFQQCSANLSFRGVPLLHLPRSGQDRMGVKGEGLSLQASLPRARNPPPAITRSAPLPSLGCPFFVLPDFAYSSHSQVKQRDKNKSRARPERFLISEGRASPVRRESFCFLPASVKKTLLRRKRDVG